MIINRHSNYVAYTGSFTANILYFNIYIFYFFYSDQTEGPRDRTTVLTFPGQCVWLKSICKICWFIFVVLGRFLNKANIKLQPKRDVIKLSNLFKLLLCLALKCLVSPLTAETAIKRYFFASWISTHSKLAMYFFFSVSNSCLIQRHMLGSLFTDISYLWRSLEHGKSLVSSAWYCSTRLDSLLFPGTFLDFVFQCR